MNETIRTWGLRLLALAIAVAIWFSVSLEERAAMSEKLVEASISYNRPRGFVILDPVDTVQVRLRGNNKAITRLSPFMVDVQIDLSQPEKGPVTINLGPENVLRPDGLEVVSIEPNVIRVGLDAEVSQRLRVVPALEGEPAAGATAGDAEVFPSHVMVTGPESLLSRIETLTTRPVRLDDHAVTFEETVAVVTPNSLIQVVQPSRVTVRVPIEPPEPTEQEDQS